MSSKALISNKFFNNSTVHSGSLKFYFVFVILFLQMYVTLMFRAKGTRLTKPTLSLVLLSLAVLVGVIRVTEHRNHWNDVLAGFITGGAIAAFLVRETERRDSGRRYGWVEP